MIANRRLAWAMVIGFAGLVSASDARAAAGVVELALMCPLTSVDAPVDNAVEVVIGRGRDDGITVGMRGWIFEKGEKSGVGKPFARGEVVKVEAGSARVRARLDGLTKRTALATGAQFEARILVPSDVHRGQILNMMLLGISFQDNMRKPFTTLKELLSAKDDSVERRVLAAMVEAGKEVIEFTDSYKTPITHGKWKGQVMSQILAASSPDDYRAFLRFVTEFPGKYIAHDWKISETYATWIVNDVPPSAEDRLAELAAIPDAAELAKVAKALTPEQLSSVLDFVSGRIDGLPSEKQAEAESLMAMVERLMAAVGQLPPTFDGARARLEFARAEMQRRAAGKGPEAAAAYRRASDFYVKAGEMAEALVARNNGAGALYDAERYDEALAVAAEVRAIADREKKVAKDPSVATSLSLREAYAIRIQGFIANKRGQYHKVIDGLSPLVVRYGEAGIQGARELQIDLLSQIAQAQKKLGLVDEARATYQRIEDLAVELSDTARQARLAFDVGELFWGASRWEDARKQYARSAALAKQAGDRDRSARALAAEGQALWQLGRHAEALARHQEALVLRRQVGDRSGTAWQLLQMGKIRRDAGDREEARGLFAESLGIRQELKQRESEAEIRLELGNLELALKRGDEAEKQFAAARDLYRELKSLPDEAAALMGLVRADVARRRPDASVRLGEVIALDEKIGDKRALADALLWQGSLIEGQGDREAARAAIERARAQAPEDVGLQIDVLENLANLDLSDGKLEEGGAKTEEALRLAEKAGDVRRRLTVLSTRHRRQVLMGEYDAALVTSEERIALARASGNRPALGDGLQSRAGQLISLGRLAEARHTAEEAMEVAEKNDDPAQKAWALDEQASVASAYGQQQERLRLLGLAVAEGHESGDRYTEGAMLANHSFALVEIRDLDGALAEGHRAEEVAGKTVTAEFRLKVLGMRGEILWLKGSFEEAGKAVSEALSFSRSALPQEVPSLLVLLARVAADRGDLPAALKAVEEAVGIEAARAGKPYGALGEKGVLLVRAGEDQRAVAVLREAIARAEARGGALPWEPLYNLGVVEARSGDVDAALKTLNRAVKSIESGESALSDDRARSRYWSDKAGVYQLLIKLMLGRSDIEGALRYLERAKSAELANVQRRVGPGSDPEALYATELESQEARFEKLLDEELRHPKHDVDKVRRLRDGLSGIRRRRAGFLEKLDRNSALFDRYALRPLELEKIQHHLEKGVLVVSPVLLDDRVVVFAVSADGITHRESPIAATEVAKLVEGLRAEMHARKLNADVEAEGNDTPVAASLARLLPISQRLYDVLLRPVLDGREMPKVLVVSPAGVLRYLPFAALHDGKQWLAERTTLLGMTTLDRENLAGPKGKAHGTSLLAISNPDGTLPGAQREVAAVRKLFARSQVLDGAAATVDALRDQLRVPGFDILHLAAHGMLDAINPEQSRIVLAGEPLTYADIPSLKSLKTNLVVLSACDTAVGTGGTGVEIAGLAYQFQRTDVHTVLATLWPVDDSTTGEVMSDFYRGLKLGKAYPEALSLAQRKMATGTDERHRHPVYWAPFLLLGAP